MLHYYDLICQRDFEYSRQSLSENIDKEMPEVQQC